MKLYHKKQINLGFIVVCPTSDPRLLKNTLTSLKCNYSNRKVVTVEGGSVISQINKGMQFNEWNLIIMVGTWVRGLLDEKFSCFIESEKDVLFPIINRKTNFIDASWNGVMIHGNAIKDLGLFSEDNFEQFSKLIWATQAIEKGYKFKGVVGASLK